MTKNYSMPLLIGAALGSLLLASCTDWGYTQNRIISKQDPLESSTGTRTAVDVRTNKLYKIITTTDPSNVGVNNPVRVSETPKTSDTSK